MLGDDYINQHVWQEYRRYVELTSCRAYLTDTARSVEALLYRNDSRPRWYSVIEEMNNQTPREEPEESAEQAKNQLLAKINGKEG